MKFGKEKKTQGYGEESQGRVSARVERGRNFKKEGIVISVNVENLSWFQCNQGDKHLTENRVNIISQ